jgi:hypothetical protein
LTQAGVITAATKTDPVVITSQQKHFLADGDVVQIFGVVGMEELNSLNSIVTVIDDFKFSLNQENGTNFGTYASGGIWQKTQSYSIAPQPRRGILTGVTIDVNRSDLNHSGRVYLAFVDQADFDSDNDRYNVVDHDNTDIFVIASDDRGKSWSSLELSPRAVHEDQVRVNDDNGTASQFMPWLDVDQSTGNVAIAWYDARHDDGSGTGSQTNSVANDEVHYFVSFSTDGGLNWSQNQQVSDKLSNAGRATRFNFGEYNGLVFADNTLHMSWADNSNSTNNNPDTPDARGFFQLDTYYDRISLTNASAQNLLDDINGAINALPALAGKINAIADGNRII